MSAEISPPTPRGGRIDEVPVACAGCTRRTARDALLSSDACRRQTIESRVATWRREATHGPKKATPGRAAAYPSQGGAPDPTGAPPLRTIPLSGSVRPCPASQKPLQLTRLDKPRHLVPFWEQGVGGSNPLAPTSPTSGGRCVSRSMHCVNYVDPRINCDTAIGRLAPRNEERGRAAVRGPVPPHHRRAERGAIEPAVRRRLARGRAPDPTHRLLREHRGTFTDVSEPEEVVSWYAPGGEVEK